MPAITPRNRLLPCRGDRRGRLAAFGQHQWGTRGDHCHRTAGHAPGYPALMYLTLTRQA
ncbi:hypothetical protein [Falsiroseomonas sp. E2-1-a4]|uniref:hypothetical protein n=1 Tax=Falsiroseomonas sp. E2-1-a4 TaxID=3239299 RepID=UPI003F386F6F